MASEQRHSLTPIAKWLFGGAGFSVFVLILSTTIGFLVLNYSSTQQERRRLLVGRVTVLEAIRAETATNLERAKDNVEALDKAARQRGTYPGLLTYSDSVWNAVGGSEGIVSLSPKTYVDLGLSYGRLVSANRDYLILQEHNLLSPLQVRSVRPEEYDAQDRNRANILRRMSFEANVIHKMALPLMRLTVSMELGSAKTELAEVESRIERFRRISARVGVVAAVCLGIMVLLAVLEIIYAVSVAASKAAQTAKTSEPEN
jgi:hypothetical protein